MANMRACCSCTRAGTDQRPVVLYHVHSRRTLRRARNVGRDQVCTGLKDPEIPALADSPEAVIPDNVLQARQWIQTWRAKHEPSRWQLWKMCIKPPMYSVGVVPVIVGAAMAYLTTGVFMGNVCRDLCLGSILVIAWLNLSNDAFDARTGVDTIKSKPESIVNLIGGNWQGVLVAAFACLAAGLHLLLTQVAAAGSAIPGYLLMCAIACGYIYQGPPFRLSYKGLGEPLCFVAFGPLATVAFYLYHALPAAVGATIGDLLQANSIVWPVSAVVGLTTTAILFCSHFHQISGDTAAGKNSPLVRLGTRRGCQVLQIAAVATHALAFATMQGHPQLGTLAPLTLLAAPFAFHMLNFAGENHTVPAKIKPLKIFAIKWHICFGFALFLIFFAAGVNVHGADSLA